jgi:branched-chain amino acid transport system substrate-binding protein
MKLLLTLILFGTVSASAKKIVRIGLASNYSELSTVSFNPFGGYFKDAIDLAVSDNKSLLNSTGIELDLVPYDYGTNDINVIKKAKEASASTALAVIGYNYSAPALLSAPIHTEEKIPVIYPSASANRLSTFGKYVHLGSFSNQFMVETLAKAVTSVLKKNNILILTATDCAYCMDLASSFSAEIKKHGGKIVKTISLLQEETDFTKIAAEAKSLKFDAVFVPTQELTAARLISALTEAGITKPFLGADGWGNEGSEFFRVLKGKKFTGYSVTHWHPKLNTPKSKKFVTDYVKRFNKLPNDTSVLAYDSMTILIHALVRTKPLTRESLEKTLSSIKNFDGVTGKSYWEPHQAPRKNILVLKTTHAGFAINQIIAPQGGVR